MDHPFLRLASVNRTDMATDAAHHLILRGGTAALSVRAVADGMDLTPPGLLHNFGDRERMLTSIARCYAGHWEAWLSPRVHWLSVPGALPENGDEIQGVSVWLALCALARSTEGVREPIDRANAREREALRRAVVDGPFRTRLKAERDDATGPPRGPEPDAIDLDLLQATVHGLRHRLTDPTEPLPLAAAAAALARMPTRLVGVQDPEAA